MCFRICTSTLLAFLFAVQAAGQAPAVGGFSPWPRVVIVVFERRVPPSMASPENAGDRLRELRERAVSQIQALNLRKGDRIFAFADGLTAIDFACLVNGVDCEHASTGSEYLPWSDGPVAARKFLARMLQLPARPNPTRSIRETGPDGEQFLSLTFDGNINEIDCALRREITAPLTKEYDPSSQCPEEGAEIDQNQTRAISRVELSLALQVDNALTTALRSGPVNGVTWVWALLGEKNYKREDTLNGIRQDFQNSEALIDFFSKTESTYHAELTEPPTRLAGGQSIAIRSVESATTRQLLDRLADSPDSIQLTLGSRSTVPLPRDLVMTRSFLGGPWKPWIDSYDLSIRMAPSSPGSLLAANLDINGTSTAAQPENGTITFQPPQAGKEFQEALGAGFGQPGKSFQNRVDVIVSGEGIPAPYNFAAVPGQYTIFRSVSVQRNAATAREKLFFGLLLAMVFAIALYILRLHTLELSLNPAKLEWTIPAEGDENELQVELCGHSSTVLGWLVGQAMSVSLTWRYFPPQTLPVKARSTPVEVFSGEKSIPPDTTDTETILWRSATRKPRLIKMLRFRLNSSAFDTVAISRAMNLASILEVHIKVVPAPWMRLRRIANSYFLPASIQINEVAPQPEVSFQVFSSYRRLGFASAAGGEFAFVTVENCVRNGGVARNIEVRLNLTAVRSSDCLVHFTDTVESTSLSFALSSREDERIGISLTPRGKIPDASPPPITGYLEVEIIDCGTGSSIEKKRRYPWTLTWLPHGAQLVGLDIGTSGTRMFLDNPASPNADTLVNFWMSEINPGDPEVLEEFPSLVLIDSKKGVVRAGWSQFGIRSSSEGEIVESPKAGVLHAMGNRREEGVFRDFEYYVSALGKVWKRIRKEYNIDYARFVVTVPGSYNDETRKWYCKLLREHFEGVVAMTLIREAESAAYFRILREMWVGPRRDARLPQGRDYRTLVIDLGAGTTDFAVVAARSKDGDIQELELLAYAYTDWAGDRYDEALLKNLFGREDAEQLIQNFEVRYTVRRFKELQLAEQLRHGDSATISAADLNFVQVITSETEFLSSMEDWFGKAITAPMKRLAAQLSKSDCVIDQLLLAGRGTLAFGCRSRIEEDARRLFPAPDDMIPGSGAKSTASRISANIFSQEDLPGVIAKGALAFARSGITVIGDSDTAIVRDVVLVVECGSEILEETILKAGTQRNQVSGRVSFGPYKRDITRAWIIAGRPFFDESVLTQAVSRIRTNDEPGPDVDMLDVWRDRPGFKRLELCIDSEDLVRFETHRMVPAAEGGSQ